MLKVCGALNDSSLTNGSWIRFARDFRHSTTHLFTTPWYFFLHFYSYSSYSSLASSVSDSFVLFLSRNIRNTHNALLPSRFASINGNTGVNYIVPSERRSPNLLRFVLRFLQRRYFIIGWHHTINIYIFFFVVYSVSTNYLYDRQSSIISFSFISYDQCSAN